MAMQTFEGEEGEQLVQMFGPAQVDRQIRHAIQFCWMGLPKERRSIEEVETQIRRMVERALKDFREDRQAFAAPDEGKPF